MISFSMTRLRKLNAKFASTVKVLKARAIRFLFCNHLLTPRSYVFSLNPSKLAQFLLERVQLNRATGSSTWIQVTDASDFPWLLRLGEGAESIEHHAKRIGKQLQFFSVACYLLLAAFYHLITLSALASSWVESPGRSTWPFSDRCSSN